MPSVLLDAGPLVAYLYPRDAYHDWAVRQFAVADAPFLTCEAALTEACFLTVRNGQPPVRVLDLVMRQVVRLQLDIEAELKPVRALMERYANVPMSLADACLVRMAEVTALPICTLDSDFAVYRAHGRRVLNLISPTGRYGFHEAEDEGDAR
ncbi:MAG TPA: PIN domain-containing protein [Stellaceae bacterium]|nr:PIN domain-containing protein [Stellaceae bacterium]